MSYSSALGGAERALVDVATGLEETPTLLCPLGPLAEAALAAGLRVEPVRARRLERRGSAVDRVAAPLRIAALAREVRRATSEKRPDQLVAWSMRSLLACSGALTGLRPRPKLVFQHNDLLPDPFVGAAVRAAARRADRVICFSEAMARDLDSRGSLTARVHVVHPGVDLGRHAPAGPLPKGPRALWLGAIAGWKRPDLALEIVASAAHRLPGLHLTLAGGSIGEGGESLLAVLRERAERPDLRGRVTFAGRLADPRPALAACGCLLHTADREPFGLALVEALAAGRPVVAPAAGGPLEIVDAGCGRLYSPGDAQAGADALAGLLEDPDAAARMGAAGRARAERLFSLDAARERYRSLLDVW